VHIDPHAWLVTLPVTVALIQLYFQPVDARVKTWWNRLVQWEIHTWGRLSLIGLLNAETDQRRSSRVLYRMAVASFAACSLASFGSFIGLFQ